MGWWSCRRRRLRCRRGPHGRRGRRRRRRGGWVMFSSFSFSLRWLCFFQLWSCIVVAVDVALVVMVAVAVAAVEKSLQPVLLIPSRKPSCKAVRKKHVLPNSMTTKSLIMLPRISHLSLSLHASFSLNHIFAYMCTLPLSTCGSCVRVDLELPQTFIPAHVPYQPSDIN